MSDTGNRPGTTPVRRRVMFVSSNGAGVGHLMRLMAMARRASETIDPLFFTMSQAVPVVVNAGYFVEYLMSSGYSGMEARPWHSLLRTRLDEVIRTHGVQAIVFDGTWPYRGLLEAFDDHPDVATIWSRRAMWKPDLDSPSPAASHRFDLIIEPGEFAEAIDRGQTAARRAEATQVAPITFLSREELLDRDAARKELGLDPQRPTALVQLGAGNINDTSSLLGAVVGRLAAEADMQVCVTKSIISRDKGGAAGAAISLEGIYPLARYLHAFDMAVAASGYNTFHELLAAAVPTLFVPNLQTQADDQAARARYAAATEVALAADGTVQEVLSSLEDLLQPDRRRTLAGNAARRMPGNGAADAMAAIEQLIGIGDGPTADRTTGDREPPPGGLLPATSVLPGTPIPMEARAKPPGSIQVAIGRLIQSDSAAVRALLGMYRALPEGVRRPIRRRLGTSLFAAGGEGSDGALHLQVPTGRGRRRRRDRKVMGVAVLLANDLEVDQQCAALERFTSMQVDHPALAPIVITLVPELTAIRGSGFPVELVPGPETWSNLEDAAAWPSHLRARLRHLGETWSLHRVESIGQIGDIDEPELRELLTTSSRRRRSARRRA